MKAAIFDMDGTLLYSMGMWRAMSLDFLKAQGIEPTPEQERDMLNLSGGMVVPYVKAHFGMEITFETLLEHVVKAVVPFYEAGAPHKPGVLPYLTRLRERGVKVILATATPACSALMAINQAGLTPHLDFIFSTDMLGLSKRDPAFFDRLCALIGEKNEDCVMFEDALYAMRGARAAGLGVIGITDSTNALDREAIYEVCDQVISSYDELP